MLPQWIIEKKRDGLTLTDSEIRDFISRYATGDIPDYQMAAMAMAIFLRGMTPDEVASLTDALMRTGDVLDTSSLDAPVADKHSTGGIGDKVSLILAPLVACCGIAVPMISGRGLGITGGTLDKLESIPGYRTDLDTAAFLDVVRACGCSIIGQTARLAPADKKLYALRDVTATVPSIPLIAASIMSKKLAESTHALVLDVKWGRGAFMKQRAAARELAETMVAIGSRLNRRMAAVLTNMNEPLGRTAGNAVEVAETVQALRGDGAPDLMAVTFALSEQMLLLTGKAETREEARAALEAELASGAALAKFREMVALHGGDVAAIDDPARLPAAKLIDELPAPRDGYVADVDAQAIGKGVLVLGAGRAKVTDTVDHAVGVTGLVKIGERIEAGRPLLVFHANDAARLAEAKSLIEPAFAITDTPPPALELIGETIGR